MPKVKTIEKKIWDIEGFNVRILSDEGRDIRGDRDGLPSYKYERAAKNDMTVATWKDQRFQSSYPGFRAAVYDGDGYEVHGRPAPVW
jgi:hypothetical protein